MMSARLLMLFDAGSLMLVLIWRGALMIYCMFFFMYSLVYLIVLMGRLMRVAVALLRVFSVRFFLGPGISGL